MIPLDEYRGILINHILNAKSQHEISAVIDTAIKALEQNKLNRHMIACFVDKVIIDLNEFNPMTQNPQHWSNIKVGRVLFNRIKNKLKLSVS